MSTRELIDAIEAGDSLTIQSAFEEAMASRIAEKLDQLRPEIAKNMFKTEDIKHNLSEDFESLTEEQVDEMINEVLSKSASAGEWIHDFVHSDNPKFEGKSKEQRKKMALAAYYSKQRNEEVELEEAMTPKQRQDFNKVQAGAMSKSDYDTKWKSAKKKSLSGPGGVYKNLTKEEAELEEAKASGTGPKPSEIHISDHPEKKGHYKVHAVGKKWKEHISPGDTLNDTELDDFAEVGGKIKHIGQ